MRCLTFVLAMLLSLPPAAAQEANGLPGKAAVPATNQLPAASANAPRWLPRVAGLSLLDGAWLEGRRADGVPGAPGK